MKLRPTQNVLLFSLLLVCGNGLRTHAQCVDARIVFSPTSAKIGNAAGTAAEANGVYQVGGPVLPPKLLHCTEPAYSGEAQKFHISGDSTLSLVVDAAGTPEDIVPVAKLGLGLDENAVTAVKGWRFYPATFNGQPVPARIQLIVSFHYCEDDLDCKMQMETRQTEAEVKEYKAAHPPARDIPDLATLKKNGVVLPKLIKRGDLKYTKAARKAKLQGFCILSFVIDEHGQPADIQVVKPLGEGLDENAVESLRQWRYQPATLHGQPVAVQTEVTVIYALSKK